MSSVQKERLDFFFSLPISKGSIFQVFLPDGLFLVPCSGRFGFSIRKSTGLLSSRTKSWFLLASFPILVFTVFNVAFRNYTRLEVFALCEI